MSRITEAATELTRSWDRSSGPGGWQEVIRRAQEVTHLSWFTGHSIATAERVRFGDEDHPSRLSSCGDCGAYKGQFHVPGCDMERCPGCGGQLITCGGRRGCALGSVAGFEVPEKA